MAEIKIARPCNVDECERPAKVRGYCNMHDLRIRRNGNPLTVKAHMQLTPETFWARVALTADDSRCWNWTGARDSLGYGIISEHRKVTKAHRYALWLVKGERFEDLCVMHSCDNPSCVNPKHLEWGTMQENFADMFRKQRNARGERHSSSKLTENEVLAIRADSRIHRLIAQDYHVARATVSFIKRGGAWKHLL